MKSATKLSDKRSKEVFLEMMVGITVKDTGQGLTVQWIFLPFFVASSVLLIIGFAYTTLKIIFMILV